jgi:UDP-glucose 4-epimerase
MRFLLTGGAGFIGSHLSDLLISSGHSVHVLDDLSTGGLENVSHLQDHPQFDCTLGSVSDSELVGELVARCDFIVHLAAAVGVKLVVENPVRAIETNVHCTEVVLAQADRHGRPLLLASTSEVYGKSEQLPFREDGDLQLGATDKSRWAYACSKAIDEFLAMAYWRERGLPVTVVRLFNTVGPRQTGSYGMVVPRLVGQALAGRPLTVYGDGRQRRCFCHVLDVVEALYGLIEDPGARGGVFNIGSTEEISIRELADRILAVTESDSPISLIPYEQAYADGFEDTHRRVPDTSKVMQRIGWVPTRTLEQVIADVANDQRRAASPAEVPRGA